jgi:2-aminoadipate transaminase
VGAAVLVPPAVRDRLVLAAESATLWPASFTQMPVSRCLGGA